ncbi:MAG: hypothetical protein IPP43_07275 [Chitinophagaceae bacterium]|nr:hypothetical protein [Chitinophagaceae bacterium]
MKKIFFLVCSSLLLFASCSDPKSGQPGTNVDSATVAQNNDYLVSMEGIGVIKIGMTQTELENLLNQKFVLRNALDSAVSWQDSVKARYKNMDVTLFFQRSYTAENVYYMYLIGLRTTSPLCKTISGISIGADKLQIITANEDNDIIMGPEYENVNDTTTTRSKTRYLISIKNDTGTRRITFNLNNKKVVAIEVAIIFNDSE